MRRTPSAVSICLLLGMLLAACGPPTTPSETPTEAATVSPQTEPPAPPTGTPVSPTPTPVPTPAEPAVTQITIDGDPVDWASQGVLLTDPAGDHQGGGFDIAAVRAFANDKFLYVLVETHGPREDYVQLDLEIGAGGRRFVIVFDPERGEPANMGEVTTGEWVDIGEVAGSGSAAAQAVEFKMPLAAFEDVTGLQLTDVRPMAGECCGDGWYAVDETSSVQVAQVDEVEAEPVAEGVLPVPEEGPPIPQVCAAEIAPPAPFSTLPPAPLEFTQPCYAAEWFVAPGVFNMPQEVILTPQGDLLVHAVSANTLFRVADDGTVTTLATEVEGYLGDVDAQGNVYLYDHSGGIVNRISPNGSATLVVQSPEIQSACDSGFGIGPDGNLYLALNRCGPASDLFQISPEGAIKRVARAIPQLQALRTAPDGRFLAASGREVHQLSLDDYSLTLLGRIPTHDHVSPGGLAMDDAGNIYLSTGSRSASGEVYRLDPSGEATLLAEIPVNGLSGIEWLPQTGEIVGGQLRQGGLIAVGPDGTLREIVPGNGIVTPMGLAFSPCGELALANDEGARMMLVDPAGEVSWFFDYISFTPPTPFVVFGPDGTLYASEGAPGNPGRVIVVPPGERPRQFSDAAMPSGLALRADGALIVAETSAGRITQINPDGATTVLVEGLDFPLALALDASGDLYAVVTTGGAVVDEVFTVPGVGDTIIRATPEGDVSTVANLWGVSALAVGPSGDLFAALGGGVARITPDGTVSPWSAYGFQMQVDLAFDLAGYLYVSDRDTNSVVRIGGFPQGVLGGVVTDESGVPVAGARVQALSDWPIVVGQVVTTGDDGYFSLPAAPRTYTVIVTAEGYEATTLEGIEVTADQETALEIELVTAQPAQMGHGSTRITRMYTDKDKLDIGNFARSNDFSRSR